MRNAQRRDVPCDLCQSTDQKQRYHSPVETGAAMDVEHFAATTDVYSAYGRIVTCRKCGLVYTNPRPDDTFAMESYKDSVDNEYLEEASGRSITAHFHLDKIRQYIPQGNLVEVGCSTGYFLNAARAYFEAQGVELCKWACEICRTRFKLDVFQGGLSDAHFRDNTFDVVAMIDIIEHVGSPSALVKEAYRILRPGGLLYVVTPNIKSLSAFLLGKRWWGLRPAHIYYFSPKTIQKLAKDHDFECKEVSPIGRVFTTGYWLSRLRHYPAFIYKSLQAVIKRLGIDRKLVYLNTRDSMEVCLIKKDKNNRHA